MLALEAPKPIFRFCMRTGCGRKLTARRSCERGFGPICFARLQRAIRVLEDSGNKVAMKAAQVLRDGALVPMPHYRRTGVWSCAAATLELLGRVYHLTIDHCTCPAGQRRIPVMCNHRVALTVLTTF
jgi:hypothetical protein